MKTSLLLLSLLSLGGAATALAQGGPGAGRTVDPANVAPRLLARFDTDGNGELSATELEGVIEHFQAMRGARGGRGPGSGMGPGMGAGPGQGPGAYAPPPPPPNGAPLPCPPAGGMGRGPGAGRFGAGGPGGQGGPRGPMLDPEQRTAVILGMFDADKDGKLDEAELLYAMEHMPLHRPPPPATTDDTANDSGQTD